MVRTPSALTGVGFSFPLLFSLTLFFQIGLTAGPVWAQSETPVVISSSPTPVGSGARAAGVANAFIAVADDATAASWNPAGLVQLEKPEISAVGSYFVRTDDADDVAQTTEGILEEFYIGEDSTTSLDLNFLSVAYPFELARRNMTVSLNYQRKFDFNKDFDFSYKQTREDRYYYRDFVIDQKGGLHALSPALAAQIIPTLSVGITFNIWGSEFFQENAWTAEKTLRRVRVDRETGTVVSDGTAVERHEFDDFSGYNATFGVLWNATSFLNFGAVVNLPFQAELQVKQHVENLSLPPDDPLRTESYKQDVEMDFPISYGFGLAYRPMDPLTFSLDYMRVEWQDFVFTDLSGKKFSVITSQPVDEDGNADVGASNTVRFGVEYLFIWEKLVWPLRGGFFYDPEPAEGGTDDYFGFAVGSGVTLERVTFDLAYVFKFAKDIRPSNISDIRTVDDALIDVNQHTLLFSLVARF
jgi:long-subunit fatty acid transport protein